MQRAPITMAALAMAGVILAGGGRASAADDTPERPPPTYFDLDFALLNAGCALAGRVADRVYVGGGASVLPAVTLNTFDSYPLEVFDARLFVRYEPFRWLQVEGGPRFSYFERFQLCIFQACAPPPTGTLVGPYAGVVAGGQHLKLGPRIELAHRSDTNEWGVLFYPLVLHVEITP